MNKVGAVQLLDVQGDVAGSMRVIRQYMAQADEQGVAVLCFPECFLQGYTLDNDETKSRALDVSSSEFKAILDELRPYRVTAIVGFIEKDGDTFYNTAAVIRQGKLLGTYRKTHLFEQNFQPGESYPVFSLGDAKFGINICYDARFNDGAAALVAQGAGIIFYPLNNRLPIEKAVMYRDKHIENLIERAKQNNCWVVSADIVANDEEYAGYGCTAIADPDGNVVARVPERQPGMTTFEI